MRATLPTPPGIVLCLFLVVAFTIIVTQVDAQDDDYDYVPREEGSEDDDGNSGGGGSGEERGEQPMGDSSASASPSSSSSSTTPGQELAKLSKEDQLMVLEDAIDEVRKNEVQPALTRVGRLTDMHAKAKANSGWIKSAAEKKRIYSLEAELSQASNALVKAQSKEMALYDQMKPLYGIVSYQFMQEQQVTIQGSLKKMNKMAYDNAWWSSVFNSGRAESLTDLVMQFFMNWLMTYILMYPFAVAYYALWSAPWSIYAYSSGATDVVPGIMAWVAGTTIMVLPLACLGGGLYLVARKFGPEMVRKAEEAREQRKQQEQRQYARVSQQRQQFEQNQRQRQQQQWADNGVGATD